LQLLYTIVPDHAPEMGEAACCAKASEGIDKTVANAAARRKWHRLVIDISPGPSTPNCITGLEWFCSSDLEEEFAALHPEQDEPVAQQNGGALKEGLQPKTLAEVKILADAYIEASPQDGALRFGLTFLGIPEQVHEEIIDRSKRAGSPPLRDFVYFRHLFGVDLFFSLAVASDQISRVRPNGKADNKVDIAYLCYLPFCHVFVSADNLHKRVVPLFLRPDQTFVDAAELKADLQKLDAYYWALPEDVKNTGFYKFAKHPPLDDSFLVTRLWDKRGIEWRERASKSDPTDKLTNSRTRKSLKG